MPFLTEHLADHLPNHWKRDCVNLTFIPVHPGGGVVIHSPRAIVLTTKRKRLANMPELCAALEHAGLTQERRAIRAQPEDLEYHWRQGNVLELRFSLGPGVFATTLLRELCSVTEPQR